ncbi:miniconductance mechanosensitive channel MscM [Enterobacteriaceae bacterium LUAb1]
MTVRLILILLISLCINQPLMAADIPEGAQLQRELAIAKNTQAPGQADTIQLLENALKSLNDRDNSLKLAKQYQQVIDDFPRLSRELRQQISALNDHNKPIPDNLTGSELDQELLQVSSQQIEENRQSQQEQERSREINDSINQLPQQQTEARRALSELPRHLQAMSSPASRFAQAELWAYQAEAAALKALISQLQLAQLSANNRLELARIRAELHQKRAEQLDVRLQALRNQLNTLRQREAETALARTEQLAEHNPDLPAKITEQFRINRELSSALNQQAQRMDLIASQQRQANNNTIQVRQALNTIREQSQWLGRSNNLLGEALRAQVARLPEMPQSRKLDSDMTQLRVQRLSYEEQLEQQNQLRQLKQDSGMPLSTEQKHILDAQLRTQNGLLNSLISGSDNLILELTRLKVANGQLEDALNEIKQATHRYLFWSADVNPVGLNYPLNVAHDLHRLLSRDTLSQLGNALKMMLTSKTTMLPIIGAILLVGFSISSRRHYYDFLSRAAGKVGKVTQDHFSLTMRTVLWSILVALPLPVLWGALGYGLQQAWPWPIAVAMGEGITATLPVLWVFMISAAFACPQGLFIVHFRWPQARVARAMHYYRLLIGLIVPLLILLIAFNNLEDRQFSSSLGRLCFILICGALYLVTLSLKRAGIPLHLDKEGNGENMLNTFLWNLMLGIPLAAALASCIGYLATSQAILARLETSMAIWFMLLVVYHIIRRWMLIQRRRIAFDRARSRRAEILAQRARGEEESSPAGASADGSQDTEEPVINLDAISAQSLRLVRSILTLVAFVSVIVLWSEIHSAFGFLENIKLWEVSSSIQGEESLQPITLGAILIAILIFIVTTQLVRNLPAMLELGLLQHLSLSPGTGYAVTTLTKYLLLLIGGLTGFSMLGIEWGKLQWLVAAMGLGLGFGLQEIFANFISGLIILFEKPIRIGDTVTIRDLTGTITRINTRATTITDWDRKEIIVPNKAFITEQFINWSLSDTVTRVVLTIPAPAEANSEEVAQLLISAAMRCSYVLENPVPEAFLVDLQQGIQLYELRIYAAEMGHRMPLRHELHSLILSTYHEHGLEMPFPPFQIRMSPLGHKTSASTGTPTARQYKSGGL